ncbi:TPA: hypothetical protein ACGZ99_003669 [Elizabethkingia anophelis]
MMKEKQQENPCSLRAPYVPPEIQVIMIEMECGISAVSDTAVRPPTINGNTANVPTDWESDDNEDIVIGM